MSSDDPQPSVYVQIGEVAVDVIGTPDDDVDGLEETFDHLLEQSLDTTNEITEESNSSVVK